MSDKKFRGMLPPLAWFANEMERQLEENDYKRGWKHCTPQQLLKRLKQETQELKKAIEKGQPFVIEEAADVANFAMMIADNFYDNKPKNKT
jgi:NTP pyrophosphatase (non-canonical NTP hydrolase)